MCAYRTMDGAGCVTWWGFSPALDLVSLGAVRQKGRVNVLLVGSGDPRHILKTIAHLSYTDTLHVWVVENCLEVVARQLLLLYLALTHPRSMGLQEKTEVFLEIFGNSEVRSQTEQVLRHMARQLSLGVTNTLTGLNNSCLDTTHLRFKDRDDLDRIFKQWIRPPSPAPSISKVWDSRVRQHLGTRYDSRLGCFDWDLMMKLHQRHRGDRVAVRGYWGDIVSSPYLSFGIETDNKTLMKTQNGQHTKTAQDISYHNVQELLRSLSSRGLSSSHEEMQEANAQDSLEVPTSSLSEDAQKSPNELLTLCGVNVTFLPVDSLSKLPDKQKYSCLFDSIYCSASMVHQLGPSLRLIAAPKAVLAVELADYLLDLSKEQVAGFSEKVDDIARGAGFKPLEEVRGIFATYTLQEE
ncbi:dynein axonemal assembly factor 3-like isoform X2 [Brienomyrus brachyistius]|uniref:dynein axonemal assembly factor 3-like isoform X2 n=1 Tax=Brienomyrus brachyistius TaxID=42636 RepID=UPI0020B293CB|nr:dynein axonemal assembly factor 3-like isoform X2 [Brienomyrus brachyistius]